MLILYAAASILGGTATAALVAPHGLLLGLLAAPFGGSLAALAVARLALPNSSPRARKAVPPDVVWC